MLVCFVSCCLWTVLFISLWSTTAETKNGLLDANKSACLRFLVLKTKKQKVVNWFRLFLGVFLCECFYFSTASLDSDRRSTQRGDFSLYCTTDVLWSAFDRRTSGILILTWKIEKKPCSHQTIWNHKMLVRSICVLILLRRHSSRRLSDDAHSLSELPVSVNELLRAVVVHSRRLGGSGRLLNYKNIVLCF